MKPSDEELEECGYDKNNKRTKPRVSSISSISTSDGGSLQDALDKRNNIALMKEENKKRKLILYEKKMEANAKKMEADAKKMEADAKKMEADAKKMEADAKVAQAMHALLMKLADKI